LSSLSLKLRLMALSTLWVIGSLTAAAVVLHYLFATTLERSVREDLEAAMTRLIALIDLETADLTLTAPMPDPRYDTPLGGRYWQIEDTTTNEMLRSRSLWDTVIPALAGDTSGHEHFVDDQDLHLIYISRLITTDGRSLQVSLGEDHLPVHLATANFQQDVFRLFLILGAVILAAAWLQLALGLAPLDRLRRAVDEVRQGRILRLGDGFPTEVRPLVDEVNALLDERETNIQRARQRASDLAHGLKTPLAALHGIAQRVRDRGNTPDGDLIDDLAFEMSKRIDYQMRLSALRLRTGDYTESASINAAILRTITVLKKTGRGEGLHWVAEMAGDWTVDIHRQDLIELVGVVLENAAKWASSRVTVHTTASAHAVTLHVADDGPGIPPEQVAQLGERGRRFDETVPGSGHGLAIASEILAINNGRMEFGQSEFGGLLVRITLPRADH
jgi:signal transduction histidine kinase